MVFKARRKNNDLVDVTTIDRYSQSTIDTDSLFYCIECESCLTYVNSSSRCKAHFRHPSTEEAHNCWYFNNDKYTYPQTFNECETDTSFVEDWQQEIPQYVCREDHVIYSLGSSKGLVTILGDIQDCPTIQFRYNTHLTTPKVFILNGINRNVKLYRTNDTEKEWVYFGRKCEIGYILKNNGIAAIDMENDYIAIVSSHDYLPDYYKVDDDTPILHMYPCNLVHIDDFVDLYLPTQYPKKQRRPIEPLSDLKNCKDEIEQAEREENEKKERDRKQKEKLQHEALRKHAEYTRLKRKVFQTNTRDERNISDLIFALNNTENHV